MILFMKLEKKYLIFKGMFVNDTFDYFILLIK